MQRHHSDKYAFTSRFGMVTYRNTRPKAAENGRLWWEGEGGTIRRKKQTTTNHAAQPEIILLIILTALNNGAKLIP